MVGGGGHRRGALLAGHGVDRGLPARRSAGRASWPRTWTWRRWRSRSGANTARRRCRRWTRHGATRFFGETARRRRWSIAPAVRRLVEFRALNLVGAAWPVEGPFDVIFCRNVLMYLEACHRYAVLERMASLLAPDGLLMLDPAEHLGKAAHLFTPGRTGCIRVGDRAARAARRSYAACQTDELTYDDCQTLDHPAGRAAGGAAGAGIFTRLQLSKIEERSRFVAESRIEALATLGNLSRSFAELRVNVRSYLLATNQAQRAAARAAFDEDERDVTRLLQQYADNLVVSDQGRRLLNEYQTLEPGVDRGAKQVMSLADDGRRDEAVALLNGTVSRSGRAPEHRCRANGFSTTRTSATAAGKEAVTAIEEFRLENAGRQLRGHPADRPAGLPDLPADRQADPGARSLGEDHRRRRLHEGGSVHRGHGRNRRPGALDRRPQAGRRRDGRAALGQVQRLQAHRRIAGRGLAGRVRAAAGFRPGAAAGRRRRGLLPVRGESRAAPADRRLRPGRRRGCRRVVRPGRGPGRPVRAGAQGGHAHGSAAGLPAHRLRSGRGRAGPGRGLAAAVRRTRCWACWRSPPSARSTRGSRRCSRNCCRWWR